MYIKEYTPVSIHYYYNQKTTANKAENKIKEQQVMSINIKTIREKIKSTYWNEMKLVKWCDKS